MFEKNKKPSNQRRAGTLASQDLVKNTTLLKSILFYACSIQFYVTNQHDITNEEILAEVGLYAYDLWRTLESFLTFDPRMPRKLKEHFLDLERQIVQHLSWKPNSPVIKTVLKILKDSKRELKN